MTTQPGRQAPSDDRAPAGADELSSHRAPRERHAPAAAGDASAPPDDGPLESLGRAITSPVTGAAPPEHDRPEELPADALRPGPNAGR